MRNTILITGSSSGIGYGLAKQFVDSGWYVLLNGRDEERLNVAKDSLGDENVSICTADVTTRGGQINLATKASKLFGGLNGLVCNVGSGAGPNPGRENHTDWLDAFQVNFFSSVGVIDSCKELIKRKNGSIVCISSICGINAIPNAPITYSSAKAALNHYVSCMARPLGHDNIRINAVAPGNILFKGSVWERKLQENKKQVNDMLSVEVPLNKLGCRDDISEMVFFLITNKSKFITGQTFTVDGGQTR